MNGNTAVLKCDIPAFVKEHVSITSWVQDSTFNIYPSPDSDGKYHMLPSGELLIYGVSPSDSRSTYRCRTVHHVTGRTVESSTQGHVFVTENRGMVPPRFTDRVNIGPVKEGDTAVLSCVSQGWFKESRGHRGAAEPLLPSERVHIRDGVVVIRSAMASDAGRYACIANNSAGSERVEVELSVAVPLSVSLHPPSLTVDVGGSAELSCIVSGLPRPTLTWRKDGLQLRPGGASGAVGSRFRLLPSGAQLIFTSVQREDKGMYQCFAKNDLETAQATAELRLGVHGDVISHVNVSAVRVEDGGEYRCNASNRVGSASHSARLNIYGLPHIRPMPTIAAVAGRDLVLKCPVAGFPVSLITWEKDAYPQLVYKFIEQTMQPGPSVSLKCIAAGNPTPHFTWTLDGFPLPQNDRLMIGQYVTVHGDVISHVNVSAVRVEDGGEYRCNASNRVGSASHSARLNIYGLPHIRPMPTIAAVAGRDLVLKCPVAGFPVSLITWEKDNQFLPVNLRQEVAPNGTLIIRKVDSNSDKGTYACVARNKQGHSDRKTVEIDVKVPPKIEPFSFPENIQAGSRVHVTCVVSEGDSPLRIEWTKDGRPVRPGSVGDMGGMGHAHMGASTQDPASLMSTYQIGEFDLALRIVSVSPAHNGNYTCKAGNEAASTVRSALLLVHVPPRIAPFSFNKDLSEGVRAQVTCVIEKGDPPFAISWLKDSEPIPSSWGLKIIGIDAHSSTIVLERVTSSHTGNFTCLAKNSVAEVSHTAELVVSVPPRWVVEPQDEAAAEGIPFALHCQAEGFPHPTITWRKAVGRRPGNYRDLVSQELGGIRIIQSNGTLLLPRLNEDHEGYYLCEAINGIGAGLSKVIYLTVNEGVVSELGISTTTREDSGRYYCIATNAFGRDETSIQLYIQEPPDFPRNLRVIERGSRFVKLEWVLSQDGNSPITKYTVEYKTSSGEQIKNDVLDVSTDGEKPGGAPKNIRVDAVSSSELHVIWDAPDRDLWNGETLTYHVGYKEKRMISDQYQYETVAIRQNQAGGGECILSNLKKFTRYTIIVVASNNLGSGPASEEINAYTLEDVPSAPPQDVRCTAFTSQSLQVSWDPPPDSQIHGLLKGYKVIWESAEVLEATNKPETKITTALSVVVHGLEKYSNYSIQVLAYTRVGDGVASSPLFCITEEDVPDSPAAIKAVISSPTSIIVSWLPPVKVNGIITTYNLHVRALGNVPEVKTYKRSLPPQHTSYEAEGLHKRGQYEFSVTAMTKVGEGPRSETITLSPSTEVRAAIYSFGRHIVVPWKQEARLPCQHVGKPEPNIIWRQWGQPLKIAA
ncbi:hypothetical protein J437_LFUL018191, partial [Ladona fulva]